MNRGDQPIQLPGGAQRCAGRVGGRADGHTAVSERVRLPFLDPGLVHELSNLADSDDHAEHAR